MVGKIDNHPAPERFERGMEKGMFRYGGSTVILLIEPGRLELPERIFALSAKEEELPVCMGERIANLKSR